MAIRGEKNGYIAKFLPGEKLLYSHFSGGKFYYIAIFPGGKMARGKNYYTTPDKCQKPKLIERLVLWYEFDFDGKFRHVKLLIKEKYPHTIITERYRFCCFKEYQY